MAASKVGSQVVTTPERPICLSLQKFSSAVILRDSNGPLPWTHLASRGELFAIFDTVRHVRSDGTIQDAKRFKILRDPDVLEDIDLQILASETKRAINMAKDASDHNRDHNVAVIKKVPVIAVKYPVPGGQVKRFQIRFSEDADFYEACKQMSNSGVHMLEAGTFPSTRQGINQPVKPVQTLGTYQQPHFATRSATSAVSAIDPRLTNSVAEQHMTTTNQSAHKLLDDSHCNEQAWMGTRNPVFQAADDINKVNIDLYTPRTSTAPPKVVQHLSQLLPPPRELPFKPKEISKRQVDEKTISSRQNTRTSVALALAGETDVIVPDSQVAPDNEVVSKKRKAPELKTAAKTNKPAKKSRQPAYRCDDCKARGPRSRCRHRPDTPPLPSIEEVFSQADPSTARARAWGNEIDTQLLLARSAATKKRAQAMQTAPAVDDTEDTAHIRQRVTRSMSIAAQETTKEDDTRAVDKSTSALPYTPADQLLQQPHSPPEAAIGKRYPSPSAHDLGLKYQRADDGVTSHPSARPDPNNAEATKAHAAHNRIMSAFSHLADTRQLFEGADERLEAFADLPKAEREKRLEQFMLNQVRNPAFKVLCQAMESTMTVSWGVGWQAV
ncbi:uncharacterized protein AB675_11442 [Cyphellophora attinorum]|uniref:Uncharacterized protein n=1 Tax=Cyphellophora attinorum TaxID=1664694 RepID=A0A0N1P132_9EURO|nr:uncharacterized protein AB675_11442 [Phialophora attinorum]KPI39986.1 hypothetical protein AB675_11442 [Phialophora attinorum]